MAAGGVDGPGVHLTRTEEQSAAVDAVVARFAVGGRRAGLDPLLGALDRRARRTLAPGRRVHRAWTWDAADRRDRRWWPQGVTTSADAGPVDGDGRYAGRSLVLVAWYAQHLPGDPRGGHGSRVTVLDLERRRYAHVLLVTPRLQDGRAAWAPLRVHAGGLVWVGAHLHVAATARGLATCRLADLVEVADPATALGHRWVLPVSSTYRAGTDAGVEPLRFSFVSLDRRGPALLVGEYGRGSQTTRTATFPLDPATGLLVPGPDGRVRPSHLVDGGVRGAQGTVVAGDTTYVTASHGPWGLGSLHAGPTGHPGLLREQRGALPMGPEDVAWWPARGELFCATEHPRRRWVVAVRV